MNEQAKLRAVSLFAYDFPACPFPFLCGLSLTGLCPASVVNGSEKKCFLHPFFLPLLVAFSIAVSIAASRCRLAGLNHSEVEYRLIQIPPAKPEAWKTMGCLKRGGGTATPRGA